MHSFCVVLYLFSAWLNVRDQYPMGFLIFSFCFSSNTLLTCLSHASVSSVICPADLGKTSTGDDTSASFNLFIAANFPSMRGPIFVS